MRSPAHLPQLLRQLCSFLQAPGLLRLHTGRLQPLLRLLVITLPSRIMSVPELQRCQSYRGARLLRQLCTIPSAAQNLLSLHSGRLPLLPWVLMTIPGCSVTCPGITSQTAYFIWVDGQLVQGVMGSSLWCSYYTHSLVHLLSARFTPPGPG